MPQSPDLGYALGLPPADAVQYFESLDYKVTWDWQATAEAVKGQAFAISKAGSLDVLKTARDGLVQAANSGFGEAKTADHLGQLLAAKGWTGTQSRLKTIVRTNMQTAFTAARWKQAQASKSSRPYLQYVAIMDAATRPSHAALHGLVFHIDDPFWHTHMPPNGYNCRCRIRSISSAALRRRKLRVTSSDGDLSTEKATIGVDRETGEANLVDVEAYRTPPRPVRVAQRDSAPGEAIRIEKGQRLPWDPSLDPKFEPGDGPDWRIDVRRSVVRTDPGFGFNAAKDARWDATGAWPDALPGDPRPAGGVMRMVEGQKTWKDFGRPDLREVPGDLRLPAPKLLPAGKSRSEALQILGTELKVSPATPSRIIQTPIETVQLNHDLLSHIIEKRDDARERYGKYLLPTLEQPFEVYLTEYQDGFRTRYLGLFEGAQQVLVVARVNRDGSVIWNFMQGSDKALNKQRVGELLAAKGKK